ncbi:MAG: tRNA (adenosine(37)-N6)-threonylcarbamoyltransferase complex dimerization subunit type 1 TsaB [Bdellovibrionaceae bacterium]|nr:tRNA (adenosine(37)-N6)-threonylcarbamoyltransferase complex dimerization subunit type 1 TsaB [Pseudobdellovibrionaceae bacterium]
MLTLTLDTSTHRGTVAISENGSVVDSCLWDKNSSHSEQIVTEIDKLFLKNKRELSQTQRLICGIGPGSFTGIRVALSFVRTLANGLGLMIIPVDDCWAIALNAHKESKPISVVLDAQKNMFFYGCYQWENNFLKTLKPATLLGSEELLKNLEPSHCVITNVVDFFVQKNISISNLEPYPSAEHIYNHVHKHSAKFPEIHWQELSPLYLRASAAEEVLALRKK